MPAVVDVDGGGRVPSYPRQWEGPTTRLISLVPLSVHPLAQRWSIFGRFTFHRARPPDQ